ncbi:helix-turn-helix domain-containing protein [Pedobacter cryoconitis]|uniref:Helix-turn-helix protein n=1 Tax=Pedobacter cryoconitis TaxID=188932 RepID=A0A327SVQ6_9SPHI|nr:helix-turn-helix domain-containing protein [Pedobacter cryoconitis]RAJ33081.1 helix-turn-helix protein [Pedobacter cryoconitis]
MRDLELEEEAFLIFIHEDFLNGHSLHQDIKKYHHFDYEINEALHLSPREEKTLWELYFLDSKGLPSVNYMAEKLNISPGYLSNVLKVESGKTALEHIHIYLISEAKNRLIAKDQNVSEIAYALGFENLSYFSRLFKKEVGVSPNIFKKQMTN